jgi:CubicO group peptidase (beta-lactamase class C family)
MSSLPAQIQALIEQFMQQEGFSGSVMVVQNGQEIFDKGYGDARAGEPNGPNTTFNWNSISKLLTTVAVLQLSEGRNPKINLDDPITKYFPEYKNSIGLGGNPPVTIRSLLAMTSGIADTTTSPPAPIAWQSHAPTLKEIMDYVAGQPRSGQGTWSYSNSSFNLLALIVGRVSQPSKDPEAAYSQYLQKHIFDPAGMTTALDPVTSGEDKPDAEGHVYDKYGHLVPIDSNLRYPDWLSMRFGTGDIIGSVGDFEKFDSALNCGKLITMKDLDLMQSQKYGGFDRGNTPINGHSFLEKDGSQIGKNSCYLRFPDDNTTIFITENQEQKPGSGGDGTIQYLALQIALLLFPEK